MQISEDENERKAARTSDSERENTKANDIQSKQRSKRARAKASASKRQKSTPMRASESEREQAKANESKSTQMSASESEQEKDNENWERCWVLSPSGCCEKSLASALRGSQPRHVPGRPRARASAAAKLDGFGCRLSVLRPQENAVESLWSFGISWRRAASDWHPAAGAAPAAPCGSVRLRLRCGKVPRRRQEVICTGDASFNAHLDFFNARRTALLSEGSSSSDWVAKV